MERDRLEREVEARYVAEMQLETVGPSRFEPESAQRFAGRSVEPRENSTPMMRVNG